MRMLLLLALLASPLFGQEKPVDLKVGMEAPNFRAQGALINPPPFARTLEDCRGDVILLMEWNVRDGSAARVADIQPYWERHGGHGLTVFAIHRLDFEKIDQVRRHVGRHKLTVPVAMGGMSDDRNDFFKYRADKGFRTTIIDIEGKIAYYDTGDGFKAALDRELARVNYPNLGKHVVDDGAVPAARNINKRDYGAAIVEAKRLLEGGFSETAIDDLELIIRRMEDLGRRKQQLVEQYKQDKRWDLARDLLNEMRREFKGHKIGEESQAEYNTMRSEQRAELRAYDGLKRTIDRYAGSGDQTYINALNAYANANKDTAAAELAVSMAKEVEAAMAK